jgi:hypothetical protein
MPRINPNRLIPKGPKLDLDAPPGRAKLSSRLVTGAKP